MPVKRAVVNASPLICLSKAGLLHILPALFKSILVPDVVFDEIAAKKEVPFSSGASPFHVEWLQRCSDIVVPSTVVSWDLGAGESAVIAHALHDPESCAIIDDREARRCAESLGCRYMGTVGVILLAKERGIIVSVRLALVKLEQSGLWMSETFITEVCKKAGE